MVSVAGRQTEETRAAQSCHEFLEAFAIRIILSVSVIANQNNTIRISHCKCTAAVYSKTANELQPFRKMARLFY